MCCSADQEISCLLWNVKAYYCVHKIPALLPIPSQLNPLHTLTTCFQDLFYITCLSSHDSSAKIMLHACMHVCPAQLIFIMLVELFVHLVTAFLFSALCFYTPFFLLRSVAKFHIHMKDEISVHMFMFWFLGGSNENKRL